jgi:hypothetical protein
MAAEAALRGEGGTLAVRIDHYIPLGPRTGAERNPLDGTVKVSLARSASFEATSRIVLPAEELARFTDELATLDRLLEGEATLCRDPDYFQARVSLIAGKGVFAGAVFHANSQLTFDAIPTDQTYVAESLRESRCLLRRFRSAG